EIVPFDDDCSIVYSKIRSAMELKGTIIGPNDYIIAATVLAKNGILVTNNTKEFARVKSLKIENWTVK
ncbi:MAG TPA: PIN domain-containing protein, partial [Bacteroidales bacterium]|nr:PIN domain-containing protein [Bacteroidales bacterium]